MKLITTVLLITSFAVIVNIGLDKQEKIDCKAWTKQIKENNRPELSGWEKEMCSKHL